MLKMDRFSCCEIIADESCKCPINFNQQRTFFEVLIREILQIFNEHILQKYDFSKSYNCNVDNEDLTIKNEIEKDIRNNLPAKYKALTIVDDVMKIKLSGIVQTINGFSENVNIANYKSLIGLSLEKEVPPIRRFYRIGTTTVIIFTKFNYFCQIKLIIVCTVVLRRSRSSDRHQILDRLLRGFS